MKSDNMKRHRTLLVFGIGIILIMLVIGLSGCIEEKKSSDLGYKNTEYGFALNPPEGWTVEENAGFLDTVAMFLGPTEDNFNINMVITANTSAMGVKDSATIVKGTTPTMTKAAAMYTPVPMATVRKIARGTFFAGSLTSSDAEVTSSNPTNEM